MSRPEALSLRIPFSSPQTARENTTSPDSKDGRLMIVSNRLPITIKPVEDEGYSYKASSGGLVSGLSGLLKTKDYTWFGWPGLQVPEEDIPEIETRLKSGHSAVPVWFDDELADRHYNGFSNEILWALLHYHPGEFTFDESAWTAYRTVNRLFADRIIHHVEDGDMVWVHDYHLMLLPEYLRELTDAKGLTVKIGWFLHTPWPSSEVYRVLPSRTDILEGVLKADLVGFHTYDYARHFVSSCNRLLSVSIYCVLPEDTDEETFRSTTIRPSSIHFEGRDTGIGAFPIGIDPIKFAEGLNKKVTQDKIKHFRDRFRDAKIIIGCDRLDYIKAIPHKLHAFQYLLEEHPELIGKVQLVQIAIPSREDVAEYQQLKRLVNELVGQINGSFGTVDFQPVHLKHTSVSPEDLMALFSISDACLITSTRDGMNLVAYEYVACQEFRHGSLVLSEFAGCAQSFAGGAIICNPWDIESVTEALYEAVTMSDEKRKENHDNLWSYVNTFTSEWWGNTFIDELNRVTDPNRKPVKIEIPRDSSLLSYRRREYPDDPSDVESDLALGDGNENTDREDLSADENEDQHGTGDEKIEPPKVAARSGKHVTFQVGATKHMTEDD